MSIIEVTNSDILVQKEATEQLKEYFSSLSAKKERTITYDLHTYGCQLNESDSEKISGMFKEMGIIPFEESGNDSPDIVLLNTCAVRENAEDRLFGNLGEFKSVKKTDRDLIIIVCGCMMKVEKNVERIKKSFPYVDLVFDPQQIHNLPVLLRDSIKTKKQMVNITSEDYIADDDLLPVSRERKFRALVPIMYGCNNFCTYCIVPYARGRERSRVFESVIDELKKLAAEGYKEVMLLGQNVNSYAGLDKDGNVRSFPELLRAAAEIEGFSRIRFMSSHPKDLSDEVIEIMGKYPNVEKHLHLAMQSGSDAVLKRMNRPYTISQYMDTVKLFRKLVPGGSLTTDIIVGFPGETEEDFVETLKAVKEAAFDAAFTFQYSVRPGTVAESFEDRVSKDVVTERFGRLLELQNNLTYKSNQAKIGLTEEVLIEGESNTASNILSGRTKSNHLINFTIPENMISEIFEDGMLDASKLEGKLCMVKFTNARPYSIDGVMENIINE